MSDRDAPLITTRADAPMFVKLSGGCGFGWLVYLGESCGDVIATASSRVCAGIQNCVLLTGWRW